MLDLLSPRSCHFYFLIADCLLMLKGVDPNVSVCCSVRIAVVLSCSMHSLAGYQVHLGRAEARGWVDRSVV